MLPKNETKYEDMLDILDHLQQYIPAKTAHRALEIPDCEERIEFDEKMFEKTLIGGDQLTAARARGSILVRANCVKAEDRLDGVLPTAEDWHAKLCFLEVIHTGNCVKICLTCMYVYTTIPGYLEETV